ncbi:MAG: carboxypeptidase-like regulatory domain-containing protein, partial [Anaerolineales bacterium]|nr:carboxypeptidase-like regulatory domain-containing protein [Anaerolineales bacterium]
MNRSMRSLGFILILTISSFLFAQMTVSGTVTDAATGAALAGANVVVVGTDLGAAADKNGSYTIDNVPNGATLTASMIGYTNASATAGRTVNFALIGSAIEMSGLEVMASRAGEKTPVAYTTVTKADMEVRLGSQDIPMALNTTPSVYATQQGGGAGDARINVRGFNQRNVAVMINGVPQNDMENGWVYWSNWDGVGDASHSIQMQRGLSAVNLATPSIGGTMNIITDPTAASKGGFIKQEVGAGSFLKTSINYNTGLIGGNLALSTTIVRKTGEGVIDKTWTDAWAYYFGASYQLNDANRFEVYAIGAPQRHGQNLYKQNLGAYDSEFAESVEGYDATAVADDGKFVDTGSANGVGFGRTFNQNWAPVSSSYTGQQYWYMYGARTMERHDPNYLNERENFFHKPLVNLNHYLTLNDQMRLSTVLYWSGGSGGGTGTYGKIPTMDAEGNLGDDDYKFYYGKSPWVRDWNTLIAYNSGNSDTVYVDKSALARTHGAGNNQSVGILRNSINRQSTIGVISKLNYDLSDALKLQVGVDWRTAGIEHAREVRDLMGGDYYLDFADDNGPASGKKVGLGDIIAYWNETTVDWLGAFAQGSYSSGPINAYGMGGFSQIAYTYQDHFTVADAVIDHGDPITTMQFKGGAMYDINDNLSAFANFGLVEKPPIMDNVIYFDGTVASDPANEKFQSIEAGVRYRAGNMAVKAGYYITDWIDRNLTKAVTSGQGSSGDTDVIFLTGVNQNHSGLEVEADIQVIDILRLNASVGLGTWKFTEDATGNYQEDEFNEEGQVTGQKTTAYTYALKDLFVGDMPQTGMAVGATVTPMDGLSIQALFNYYDKNYSDWSPNAREVASDGTADREQVWMAPSYSKLDVHINYVIPVSIAGTKMTAFAH